MKQSNLTRLTLLLLTRRASIITTTIFWKDLRWVQNNDPTFFLAHVLLQLLQQSLALIVSKWHHLEIWLEHVDFDNLYSVVLRTAFGRIELTRIELTRRPSPAFREDGQFLQIMGDFAASGSHRRGT